MSGNTVDWSAGAIVARRDKYYAASQRAFMPYRTPLIFARGERQYFWDETGRKYLDLLGMNVCISVGHAHPEVTKAVEEQIRTLQHCTTMFYHPVPAHFAEELAARMPGEADWVVHFTNSGAEAIDLALVMAQTFTGNIDMLALRNAYHGATIGAQSLTGISGFRHNIPLLGGIHHVANPDPYRGIFGDDTDAYLAEIDRTIHYATSGKLAGFIVEPIQGYGGIVELPPGYLKAAPRRCAPMAASASSTRCNRASAVPATISGASRPMTSCPKSSLWPRVSATVSRWVPSLRSAMLPNRSPRNSSSIPMAPTPSPALPAAPC